MAALGTRKLTLTIDGDEVAPEVSSATISSADADTDFVSFAAAAAGGGKTYTLDLTFVQDAAATSLWNQVWTAAGSDVDVVVRPYGNATPTATEPHFQGQVTLGEPSGALIGGEANASATARWVCEVSWPFTAKPTRVTA